MEKAVGKSLADSIGMQPTRSEFILELHNRDQRIKKFIDAGQPLGEKAG